MKPTLYIGDKLFSYGFPNHPLTPKRYEVFLDLFEASGLRNEVDIIRVEEPVGEDILTLFHTREYVARVRELSERGYGYIDYGDTPAYKGIYEVAAVGVRATVEAFTKSFIEKTISVNFAGGWHHAYRDRGGGFCVFNDIAIGIEYIRRFRRDIKIFYLDIDAHHGDGIYYSYEDDPYIYIFDIHEDGRFLYPGTGFEYEVGRGEARGTKINLPLMPGSGDRDLTNAIEEAIRFMDSCKPSLVVIQGGLDGLAGDPLTHLSYTVDGYLDAVDRFIRSTYDRGIGIVFLGGGGYQPRVVAETWIELLKLLINI